METAELAFHVKRFRKSFDYISFRQLDADAVGICVSVVDVNGIGALRHRRNTEFFSEHIGGDKQTVARFMPVLIAGGSVAEGCLLYTSDAADEEDSGDLGGCRIIKKKQEKKKKTNIPR